MDISDRGFSYLKNQKLDMRFSEKTKLNAEYILNNYSEEDLSDIFYRYGEERWSARIARSIINFRHVKKLESTGELVEIIKRTIPAKYRYRGHPAKKIFQAIRIEVNSELENLKKALEESLGVLRPGGRIVIISYHSLEDRIVKTTFEKFSGRCICPPKLPVCSCGAITVGKIITRRAVRPSGDEVKENPRSKSAKLRAFEKI
ncbi:MAG: 16S rRNA (cytosine(1402)-N(4))-methyltransferase RsmH [Actinobacteria bacterium]|nr:16S rRNA (cytosine(1402)-N(4))-methyltransferase RsmH [Actinomycetota bacterium]